MCSVAGFGGDGAGDMPSSSSSSGGSGGSSGGDPKHDHDDKHGDGKKKDDDKGQWDQVKQFAGAAGIFALLTMLLTSSSSGGGFGTVEKSWQEVRNEYLAKGKVLGGNGDDCVRCCGRVCMRIDGCDVVGATVRGHQQAVRACSVEGRVSDYKNNNMTL